MIFLDLTQLLDGIVLLQGVNEMVVLLAKKDQIPIAISFFFGNRIS